MLNSEVIAEDLLDLGSDDLIRFGGRYKGGIYLQQDVNEFAGLISYLYPRFKECSYFEIGSASGGTAFVINKYLVPKTMVLLDDNKHARASLRPKILKDVNHKEIIGDSHSTEIISQIHNLGIKFDLMMIDGDHSYEGVRSDFDNYNDLLIPGGLILFHDIVETHCGVARFVNDLPKLYPQYPKEINRFVMRPGRLGIGVFSK